MAASQENANKEPANNEQMRITRNKKSFQLVEHANSCTVLDCSQLYCAKIKAYNNHFRTCNQSMSTCVNCKNIYPVYYLHAEICKLDKCQGPICFLLKQKFAMKQSMVPSKRSLVIELLLDKISYDTTLYFGGEREKLSYAEKAETYVYEKAYTQTDYFRILAVKMLDIEMDINERVHERFDYFWTRRNVGSSATQTCYDVQVIPIPPEAN